MRPQDMTVEQRRDRRRIAIPVLGFTVFAGAYLSVVQGWSSTTGTLWLVYAVGVGITQTWNLVKNYDASPRMAVVFPVLAVAGFGVGYLAA